MITTVGLVTIHPSYGHNIFLKNMFFLCLELLGFTISRTFVYYSSGNYINPQILLTMDKPPCSGSRNPQYDRERDGGQGVVPRGGLLSPGERGGG